MYSTAISRNRLFHKIPDHIVDQFVPVLKTRDVQADEVLFEEGDPAGEMYLILSGMVRVSRAGVPLAHMESGEFFGEMALLDGVPRSARVSAVLPTQVAVVDAEAFQTMLEAAPAEISTNLIRVAAERIRLGNETRVTDVLRAERLSLVGRMASSIVHDLKNPINTIRGATELLETGLRTPEKIGGMLRRASDSMLGMVQDILDYSRDNWSLNCSPVDVSQLLLIIEEQGLELAEHRGIKVERQIAFHGEFMADVSTLARALLNIIKNAGEAMPDGGTLTFGVERQDNNILFTIRDTGHGIEEAKLSTIFEPFVSHGKNTGTGLGMATTQGIVQAHNGEIIVRSVVNEGTTFQVVIPRVRMEEGSQ